MGIFAGAVVGNAVVGDRDRRSAAVVGGGTGGRSKALVLRSAATAWIAAAMALPIHCGCGRGLGPEVSQRFQEAQEAFDRAKEADEFLLSAGLYQQILQDGFVSGAVLYNQGNAFMRAGRRGEAIAAYRQAKRYRPRDPYLDANLRYALAGLPASPQPRPILDTLIFWQDWISYPGMFRMMAAFGGMTLAMAVAWLVFRRRLLAWLATAGLAATVLFALSATHAWYRYEVIRHGVVVASETIARKGNATSYEPAFTEPLHEGAEFRVVDRRGDWLLIRMAGGQVGWVEASGVVVY